MTPLFAALGKLVATLGAMAVVVLVLFVVADRVTAKHDRWRKW